MRSIVMTAGCSGCGTAAVTAAVARQLALQGKKVLLVEATAGLRRMNRLLEIREEGLFDFSDLLEGRCALENALLPTRIAGLTLLQGPSAIDWVPEAADVQLLREETEIVLQASDGRALLFSTAQLALKATRSTQGVAVMSLKKKATLARMQLASASGLGNQTRYRAKTIPAAGSLLRPEDIGQEQISLEL